MLTFGAGYRWNLTAAAGIYQMNRRRRKEKGKKGKRPVDDNNVHQPAHTREREQKITSPDTRTGLLNRN